MNATRITGTSGVGSSVVRTPGLRAALIAVVVGLLAVAAPQTLVSTAYAAEEKEERETRKTPALTEAAYKRLSEAQELIDEKLYDEALEVLRKMGESSRLNAYERASMFNMRAFVAFSMEDYPMAIEAYKGVLAAGGEEIPLALELSTLYALGQLYFVQEDYRQAITYLERWFDTADNPGPQPFIFLAQAYYQMNDFARVPSVVDEAMKVAESRDQEIKENWWLLSRAAYYEMEDWDNVIRILEILVNDFPKKEYWVTLSGLYGQEERRKDQVAAIWLAYIQGYLDQEREILNVTGLMLQDEVPYWAARILDREIEEGVVEDSAKNLQMLAQAWQLAQEVDEAIPVYQAAARKSDEGELYYRLAQLYLDKDQCQESVEAADNALSKGGLKNVAQVQLVKGMCQFNLKQYAGALESFSKGQRAARASDNETDLKSLNQWKRYVENERARDEELQRSAARG